MRCVNVVHIVRDTTCCVLGRHFTTIGVGVLSIGVRRSTTMFLYFFSYGGTIRLWRNYVFVETRQGGTSYPLAINVGVRYFSFFRGIHTITPCIGTRFTSSTIRASCLANLGGLFWRVGSPVTTLGQRWVG